MQSDQSHCDVRCSYRPADLLAVRATGSQLFLWAKLQFQKCLQITNQGCEYGQVNYYGEFKQLFVKSVQSTFYQNLIQVLLF